MALTLAEANRMLQAAIAQAEALNIKLSIAVVDAGGHLMAFNRMEGANWITATVAQGKAVAAAGFGRPSGMLQADSPVIQAVIAAQGGRMLPARGAVPQGDRTILTILLPGPGGEVLRPVWQGWSQACGLVSPRCTAWQPAPPRRRVHTARPRSAPLGSTPLVRSLGGDRRVGDVRQER